jgi:hypothetical protein
MFAKLECVYPQPPADTLFYYPQRAFSFSLAFVRHRLFFHVAAFAAVQDKPRRGTKRPPLRYNTGLLKVFASRQKTFRL